MWEGENPRPAPYSSTHKPAHPVTTPLATSPSTTTKHLPTSMPPHLMTVLCTLTSTWGVLGRTPACSKQCPSAELRWRETWTLWISPLCMVFPLCRPREASLHTARQAWRQLATSKESKRRRKSHTSATTPGVGVHSPSQLTCDHTSSRSTSRIALASASSQAAENASIPPST